MRYFARISYLGTNFHGWQRQPGVKTVQETLESNISLLIGEKTEITGCGRTDTRVHAENYIFHFDSATEIELTNFVYRLNLLLPNDIVIHALRQITDEGHARFSALSRSYFYRISGQKMPFKKKQYWWLNSLEKLDIKRLQATADLIAGYVDFTTFSKMHSGAQTNICKIYSVKWYFDKSEGTLKFEVTADRFLRGMVRLMVGCCVLVAQEKISIPDVKEALDNKTKLKKSWSVPADGLFLYKITYPDNFNL